jgi:glycosyltransferase involved in cell wall biosynthesis
VRPIRLLFVLTSPARGGVEEVVLSLLGRLGDGFRPALAGPATLLESMEAELKAMDVPSFAVAADSWTKVGEVASLADCVRRFEPDIVNPHLFRSTLVAAPLAKTLRVGKVVETYHGREAWRRGALNGSFVVDRVVARCVDRVIAVSEAARHFLVRVKRIPADKVVVIPNGRDLSRYQPGPGGAAIRRSLGLDTDAAVIGVIGRLEEQKGHAYVLEALPRVLTQFPHARLLVVGDGSLRGALEQRCRAAGIASSVLFTGFRTEVPQLLDAMDLVVLPSLYEGMPLTAIEASAMGKPVVATDVDGTGEVVVDGVTGRLVKPADAGALGEAIVEVLADPDRSRSMGRAGRERSWDRFDLSAQVAATAAAYRGVLASC